MTKMRINIKHSEWIINKHAFYTAYHYALQYAEWRDRYNGIICLNGVNDDGMPHGSGISNPTESKGMLAADLREKMNVIEETAKEASPELYMYLLKAVTNENISYNYLRMVMNIPCGKNYFYECRRKFYYLLSKKIGVLDGKD